jgi:hypothetical protein
MILPERVLGRSGNEMTFGAAIAPSFVATCWRSSSPSSSEPARREDDVGDDRLAGGVVGGPHHRRLGDGFGWSTSADSTSVVEMRWPDTFITSSTRPSSQR